MQLLQLSTVLGGVRNGNVSLYRLGDIFLSRNNVKRNVRWLMASIYAEGNSYIFLACFSTAI